jgi:hypothetical protein
VPAPKPEANTYWHNLVLDMETKHQTMKDVLGVAYPTLFLQIKLDANNREVLSLWGESFNFDSGAKKKIITDSTLNDLQELFNIKSDGHVVHAGVVHTYGYLFSNLETPYGYKRKRWIDPEVNNAFGLKGNSLSPSTKEGTLLSNVTFFAGKIAFTEQKNLEKLYSLKNVSSELKYFDYSSLKVKILSEFVELPKDLRIIIRTHFVRFQNPNGPNQNEYLLIYSTQDLDSKRERLVTVFPITREAYFKTTDPVLMGRDRPIQAKYNMFLTNKNDIRLSGLREIIEPK